MPFLTIGGTTECRAVEIHSAAVTGMAADSFAIVCDQVDGLKIHGWFENVEPNQTPRTIVDITANCKNVELAYTQHTDLTGTDESLSVGRVENYWPNSQFHGWLRGWKSIGQTRCTLSKETTTVRSGANALKVTATAANNFNYQEFLIDSDNVDLNALAGKTLTICAWVFIPDQTNFGSALRTNKALVSLHCDSTASGFINGTQNVSYVKNRWNLLVNTISMPTDPIDLRARFYVNNSATNMAGTEYIIVDSCYVIEGDNRHRAVLDGDVQDYHGISPLFIGGKMRHIADTVPSDTDLSYEVGDIIEYRTPTASSFVGEVCVTAGTGATAVFKTYGVTSA